jgi:hypothetical protein
MRLYRIALIILLVGMFLREASLSTAQPTGQKKLALFTPLEAEQLRLLDGERQQNSRMRALSVGPRIVIQHPDVTDTEIGAVLFTSSPTHLSVLFEENRAPVNMTSLQVRARKGIFTKSLTSLLRPYIDGSRLNAEGVEVPEGRFHIEIEIADVEGMNTIETYSLEVKNR